MGEIDAGDWHGQHVFVTGASGLLGSALVSTLLERGADVVCLLRDWTPSSRLLMPDTISKVTVVGGDLLDFSLLVRALNEYEINTVFHLGAQTIVGTANRTPLSTFESNVRGTWNLLEACRMNSGLIQRVVVASSDKAYGVHDSLPYLEDTPLQGRFPYDVSKSCADLIARSYSHTFGTPVSIARCGNLWGPGDLNFNRLIPGTIRSALLGEKPIIRSDGSYRRDYFYVNDAVDAYLALAEGMGNGRFSGEAFNFGSEKPVTVLEAVQIVLTAVGRADLEPIVLGNAEAEIVDQYLDCGKAQRLLGWAPRYTFEAGLAETIPWYRALLASTEPQRSARGSTL